MATGVYYYDLGWKWSAVLMTGNLLIDSVISLAAIGLMVLVARIFFPDQSSGVTMDRSIERLAFDEPDFVAVHWIIDKAGRAALATDGNGRVALIFRSGSQLGTRCFEPGTVQIDTANTNQIMVQTNDAIGRSIEIHADGAADWARKHA